MRGLPVVYKQTLKRTFFGAILGSALSIWLLGCNPQPKFTSSGSPETMAEANKSLGEKPKSGDFKEQLISDRPQNPERILAIVKLSEPAILEAAKRKDGKWEIPDGLLGRIQSEQDGIIAKIQQLDPSLQVIYRYRMVLNGLAISVSPKAQKAIEDLGGVVKIDRAAVFSRPRVLKAPLNLKPRNAGNLNQINSVNFIGAGELHQRGLRGQGLRVGVIDTGIDYTHSMLGGSGHPEEFKSVDPSAPSALFPNRKVVGGIDLVGTKYDAASEIFANTVPRPDANPIDEGAHGSHVAGTIAGIGNGTDTYSGVAPDASLYSIKVFGADGSTSDLVVVAALDWAANPKGDGLPDDRLDVVNLSLGGGFGQPLNLYSEAIERLTKAGTVVVASAGNSGPVDYIVGSPSTAEAALSVGASVDNMPHNWTYDAVRFSSAKTAELLVRAVEGPVSKPIKEVGSVSGPLVDIGLADKPLSDELKAALKGKVALIDRGGVPFVQKLTAAAEAGAIGAVVANNQPGAPIPMGGDGHVEIPAIMITLEIGQQLRAEMKSGDVRIDFATGKTIEDPSRIDTMTNFSSKGPRSIDSGFKPEITGPGEQIISAEMGSGTKGVMFSGTSMSGPHLAGAMALLKQAHPDLSVSELKALVMSTTKVIGQGDNAYPWSMQGAGRVQVNLAAQTPLLVSEAKVALGDVQVGESKTVRRELTLRNLSNETLLVVVETSGPKALKISAPASVELAPGASAQLPLRLTLSAVELKQPFVELNGDVRLSFSAQGKSWSQHVPVLAIQTRRSAISAQGFHVNASPVDGDMAEAGLKLKNLSAQAGEALLFNLLGKDERKAVPSNVDSYRARTCDLEAAGYRVISKTLKGETRPTLQVAVKLHDSLTSWLFCEISVQIDTNSDQLAEQELGGISASNLSGLGGNMASVLLDAAKARQIRADYEKSLSQGEPGTLDYSPAVIAAAPMRAYDHSSVAVIEIPLAALALRPTGELAVKVATLSVLEQTFEPDDYLVRDLNRWQIIDPRREAQAYADLPESVVVPPQSEVDLEFTKGLGKMPLLALYPHNRKTRTLMDSPQMQILRPRLASANQSPLKLK